jgi:hypothetical protein
VGPSFVFSNSQLLNNFMKASGSGANVMMRPRATFLQLDCLKNLNSMIHHKIANSVYLREPRHGHAYSRLIIFDNAR